MGKNFCEGARRYVHDIRGDAAPRILEQFLVARRLVEAGVRVVTVAFSFWDWHGNNYGNARSDMPMFDQGVSALIRDLHDRGLDKDVAVCAWGEFGRTPKINKNAGRDHWPWVYSLALAGAGIRPGTVYGASDNSAAYPAEKPHDPKDFAATLYHLLGVDPETVLYDSIDRPHRLVLGKPIAGILV